jgi:hypothetical protein
MDFAFLKQAITQQARGLLYNLTGSNWPQVSPPPVDAFYQEIYQIERSMVDIATRPSRPAARQAKPLTEQQKIIDLAG